MEIEEVTQDRRDNFSMKEKDQEVNENDRYKTQTCTESKLNNKESESEIELIGEIKQNGLKSESSNDCQESENKFAFLSESNNCLDPEKKSDESSVQDSEKKSDESSVQDSEKKSDESSVQDSEIKSHENNWQDLGKKSHESSWKGLGKKLDGDSTDDEGLVEIKLKECVTKDEFTGIDIRTLVVKCSACGKQINHLDSSAFKKHRRLGVITCTDCYAFYGSSEFSMDECGYNYCTWCGNGGTLVVCDFCPNGFCNACIRRNFGRTEISVTNQEGWKCYFCDKSRLKSKVRFCNYLINYVKQVEKRNKSHAPKGKLTVPEPWLQTVYNESEITCKKFLHKMTKLKMIHANKHKSLHHVVMKLKELLSDHDDKIKSIFATFSEQMEKNMPIDKTVGSVEDSTNIVDKNESKTEKAAISDTKPDDVAGRDTLSPVVFDSEDDQKSNMSINIEAKLALLQPSSDEEMNCNAAEELNQLADMNDSDFEAKSESAQKKISKDNVCVYKLFENTLDKLSMKLKVLLTRCDENIQEGSGDEFEKIERMVDRLCKSPILKDPSISNDSGVKKKTVKKGNQLPSKELQESSSSISLSSDDEEDFDRPAKPLPKKIPLTIISSSEKSIMSSGSDSEGEEKKKKKAAKKALQQLKKKRRKYDRLLDAPLLSDDEDRPKGKKGPQSKNKRTRLLSSEEEAKRSKSSSDSTGSDNDLIRKRPKQKRRRIKSLSSEDSESKKNTPLKGRKNIQKIISGKDLSEETKKAQLLEKERRKRILERQKLYNKVEDVTNDGREVITRKMVLEVDKNSKEEIVEIHPDLVAKLKPHQVNGVKFMWECTIESVKNLDQPGSGCILAHCMGLGKTLQVITFLHTCLTNKIISKHITKALIICPYNVILNWAKEFEMWLGDIVPDVLVHQLSAAKSNLDRLDIIEYWNNEGGVLITSYDIFRRLAAEKIPKFNKKNKAKLHTYLLDPGPDIVVCDEGHILKNERSASSKATNKLRTKRRIVLTGTPLQNNLIEYHCMLSFVKPHLLGTVKEFRNRFVNPIMNGQYENSDQYDVKLMKKRIHIMHKLLEGCVQRCDYSSLTKYLPPKHEFVISVKLSDMQVRLYQTYMENLKNKVKKSVGSQLFVDFCTLRCVWTHPYVVIMANKRQELKRLFQDNADEDDSFICNDTETEKSSSSDSDKSVTIEDEIDDLKNKKMSDEDEKSDDVEEEKKEWFEEHVTEEDKMRVEISGKIVLMLDILSECERIGDKVVIFSQSILALDFIEEVLRFVSDKNERDRDENAETDIIGSWVRGLDYFRMDGTTAADNRKNCIEMFNDPENDRARLFLISTKAGSLGTNLVGGNRVIILDTSWNPSHDVQAIFRVYRFGQVKPVYIYRLLAQGTMEEKIYDRQVTKLSLSIRVVDEQQIDRHFSAADLAELYCFEPDRTSNRPTPILPKDRLLADLLIKDKEWIVTYHEHDSLLQNEKEEDLTEEERQTAWQEYENEREGRTDPILNFFTDANIDNSNNPNAPSSSIPDDYENKILPSVDVIKSKVYDNLRQKLSGGINNPTFGHLYISSLTKVVQSLLEEQVKALRKKQDFVAQGNVPRGLNNYLTDLNMALTKLSEYINKYQEAHKQEMVNRMQQAQHMQFQNFQQAYRNIRPVFNQRGVPAFTYTRFPPQQMRRSARAPTPTATTSVPIITEVDDDVTSTSRSTPDSTMPQNTTSTVVIRELK